MNAIKTHLMRMASVRFSSSYGEFKEVLNASKNVLVLSGAGISAESGIPVFRGAGGLWRTHRATDLATPEAFKYNPSLVWEFYHYRRETAFKCQPNNAHKVLVKLEKMLKLENRVVTIVTQNVDGLHIRAGSERVIELHGSLNKVRCTKCKSVEVNIDSPICEALRDRGDPSVMNEKPQREIPTESLPQCKHCGGLLRPHIVWFGENLESQILVQANDLVETCDLCLVIGTSSIVYPAAMFAPLVAERGKPVAEFNLNEEPADEKFAFHFSGPCGTTLPKALDIEVE